MRSAPRKIDKKTMPSIADAAKMIQKTVDRPWQRLGDASIGSLVELFGDGTPAWLTGSSVWLTAVFGMPPDYGGDFDVVFSTKEATEKFVNNGYSPAVGVAAGIYRAETTWSGATWPENAGPEYEYEPEVADVPCAILWPVN